MNGMMALEISIAIVGLGLTTFGLAFGLWSHRLKEVVATVVSIETALKEMGHELHAHQISVENRITRLESRVERCDGGSSNPL
jgi:hypothetical protein